MKIIKYDRVPSKIIFVPGEVWSAANGAPLRPELIWLFYSKTNPLSFNIEFLKIINHEDE